MNRNSQFTLKDVRCFSGRKEFNVRPLTLLVGENSTGKTSLLGCIQALSNHLFDKSIGSVNFNTEPYQMGTFDSIARRAGSLSKEFELGIKFEEVNYDLIFINKKDGFEPIIHQINIDFPDGKFEVKFTKENDPIEKKYLSKVYFPFFIKEKKENNFIIYLNKNNFHYLRLLIGGQYPISLLDDRRDTEEMSPEDRKALISFRDFLKNEKMKKFIRFYNFNHKTYSLAPMRSKPERTYDPLKEAFNPEGSEIPIFLRNLSIFKKDQWENLKSQLEDFGKASGLFKGIGIRKLGNATNDPFQLQIRVRGPRVNLIDTGYGVSQILPILVHVLMPRPGGRLLLQQPEVHLHPKGQSALTSLLVEALKSNPDTGFIIETHSDYMIDRARIEIMKKNIDPDDVSLIYLEPDKNDVKVHNITFDQEANMIGEPPNYREFFLTETKKLFGFLD